jgi:hypothetical protein
MDVVGFIEDCLQGQKLEGRLRSPRFGGCSLLECAKDVI